MNQNHAEHDDAPVHVRPYQANDAPHVRRLYTDGLLAGQLAQNDTGADIDNIEEAYLNEPHNAFWIAELEGRPVGMIGVSLEENHVGEIRRLRVDPCHQEGPVAAALIETSLTHCRHHGFLKVRLDTRFERDAAIGLFDRFGFQHTRTRNLHNKDLLEFYLDLYREENNKQEP